jgi:hypothetical protein
VVPERSFVDKCLELGLHKHSTIEWEDKDFMVVYYSHVNCPDHRNGTWVESNICVRIDFGKAHLKISLDRFLSCTMKDFRDMVVLVNERSERLRAAELELKYIKKSLSYNTLGKLFGQL